MYIFRRSEVCMEVDNDAIANYLKNKIEEIKLIKERKIRQAQQYELIEIVYLAVRLHMLKYDSIKMENFVSLIEQYNQYTESDKILLSQKCLMGKYDCIKEIARVRCNLALKAKQLFPNQCDEENSGLEDFLTQDLFQRASKQLYSGVARLSRSLTHLHYISDLGWKRRKDPSSGEYTQFCSDLYSDKKTAQDCLNVLDTLVKSDLMPNMSYGFYASRRSKGEYRVCINLAIPTLETSPSTSNSVKPPIIFSHVYFSGQSIGARNNGKYPLAACTSAENIETASRDGCKGFLRY